MGWIYHFGIFKIPKEAISKSLNIFVFMLNFFWIFSYEIGYNFLWDVGRMFFPTLTPVVPILILSIFSELYRKISNTSSILEKSSTKKNSSLIFIGDEEFLLKEIIFNRILVPPISAINERYYLSKNIDYILVLK